MKMYLVVIDNSFRGRLNAYLVSSIEDAKKLLLENESDQFDSKEDAIAAVDKMFTEPDKTYTHLVYSDSKVVGNAELGNSKSAALCTVLEIEFGQRISFS